MAGKRIVSRPVETVVATVHGRSSVHLTNYCSHMMFRERKNEMKHGIYEATWQLEFLLCNVVREYRNLVAER
jgi:hypothetical protein